MSDGRGAVVQRLFETVKASAPEQRKAMLEALDADVRRQVESLLGPEDDAEPVTVEESTAIKPLSPNSSAPRRIGPYRILREIGEGGMGIVYEAEQEKPVRRKVALKLIKWGMDTKAVIGRFESERQALALMNHPNIASVHDAGSTEQGRPFFAMELVHGEPLTAYCDKQRLTVKERLDLFIQVCDGVQHAHQKGIIHRDIKPSNILVTILDDKPVPKIIDFGVAKATSQRLTEKTVYTELGQWVGTPEYMSPEQAEMTGLDIDTRTDVYSLGVVLYELLVGAQPFDSTELRRAGFDGIRRILRENEPPKPSTKVHSLGKTSTDSAKNRKAELPTLERELRGDLDWITMKALEKDRTRRYGSPSDLAADVRRHLENQPVLARPPSTIYRVRKFVRRHRVGVAAGSLILVALVIGLAGTTIGMVRATRAEIRASAEAAKATAINEFLQETLGSANPLEGLGRDATVVEALDRAVGEIDASFADQPEIEAAVRATIGLTYLRLNRYEEAEPLLRRALEIRRPLLGDGHEDTVESLNGMGLLLADQGKWDESERFIREAIELARKLGEPGEDHLGDAMLNLASLAHTRGDLDEAESIYRDVLAMLLEADDEYAVAWVRHNLAGVLNDKGDYQGAESLYRDALDGFRRTRGNEHPLVASTLRGLGTVIARFNVSSETRESEGNCEAALPLFQEAIEIDDASLGPWAAAASRRSYGRCLTRLGQYERAEDPLLQAHSDLRTVYGEEDEVTVRAVESLVELYEAWGRPEKAPSTGHYWRTQRAHHQSSSKHDTPERPPLPPLRPDESTGRAPAIGQNRQLGDSK